MANVVRPVVESDRESWESLFAAYAAFYKTSIPDGGFDVVWEWIFDAENPFWCDVVESSGQLVGLVQYQLMHRSLGGTMVCYLGDLYVVPDMQGSGCGRALIDHVLEFARSAGIPNVRWLTQEFNYPARLLYDTYTSKSDFILYSLPTE